MTTTPSSASSEATRRLSARGPGSFLVGWTLFLWASRLRLVLDMEDLDAWGATWRVGTVVIFTAMAVVSGYGLIRRTDWVSRSLVVLVGWTIVFWLVRGTSIIIDDHDLGFIIVHTVLMVVSIAAAVWVWTSIPNRSPMWGTKHSDG